MTREAPLNYEDPAVCQGVHTWMYYYDPACGDDDPWRMTATCGACGRVENWDEHMDRKPVTGVEAGGRLMAAVYLVWRATGIPGWIERR